MLIFSTPLLLCTISMVSALVKTTTNLNTLRLSTAVIAAGLLDYYNGESTGDVGTFQQPYYWWESGAAWGSLIDYWYYMESDNYNSKIQDALLAQIGPNKDYVPDSQNMTEGNDDQVFWGIAVMAAKERNFPEVKGKSGWLDLAEATFQSMADRWDTQHCGGGLRWQIYTWNNGYEYKNSVSNGGLFHLAARLARYTGEQKYVDWSEKVYNWMEDISFLNVRSNSIMVYDGADAETNCSNVIDLQWSYNAGLMMSGCAYLFDHTGDSKWHDRVTLFLEGLGVFFDANNIMWESACQEGYKCNNDQRSFKGILSRFMGLTAQLVNDTQDQIDTYLKASALAAADSCSGGADECTCGTDWREQSWDGYYGLGEQISALEIMQNLRWSERPIPEKGS